MKSVHRRHNRKYFYKYTSAETAKTILINKSLRFSSPLIFNDPFDVVRDVELPFSEEDFNKSLAAEIARLIEENVDIQAIYKPAMRELLSFLKSSRTYEELKELATELRRSGNAGEITHLESFIKEFKEDWNKLLPKSRILSLSEINDNPAMWAHYADNYRGVVLELECLDIYDSVLLVAEKVKYADDKPMLGTLDYWIKVITGQLEYSHSAFYEALCKPIELIKQREWSHEQEWRVITFEGASDKKYDDYVMPPRTFSKVYFGNMISTEDRSDIIELRKYDLAHIEFYNMEIDQRSRTIKFNHIEQDI